MDHFFKLLSEGYFKVKYDTGYNNEWFKIDTDANRKEICNHIIELHCNTNQLTELPELPNVQTLICYDNRLTVLPELPNVRELRCHWNQLTTLPELYQVLTLVCSSNQLTKLPELPNIQLLKCSDNQLTTLPELPNVKVLHCNSNQLTTLPELSKVRILDCDVNQLTNLTELPNIEHLYCCYNNLFSVKFHDWNIIWKFKKILIRVYLVPKLFSKWKLTTIRHRLSIEHKEAIICHPKTYYVRELYNESN